NLDLAVASRGGNLLYVYPGDGAGGFGRPVAFSLPGTVTTLASGHLGNAKQFAHLILGVTGAKNYSLMVLSGSHQGLVALAAYPLNAPASNIAFGNLGDSASDATFLSGGQLQILHSSSMQVESVSLPVTASAMTLGLFVYDRNPGLQVALLSSDGSV